MNIDTDELTDWVVGADEDSASVEDDDNELGNGLDPNKDIYCDYKKLMHAVVHLMHILQQCYGRPNLIWSMLISLPSICSKVCHSTTNG